MRSGDVVSGSPQAFPASAILRDLLLYTYTYRACTDRKIILTGVIFEIHWKLTLSRKTEQDSVFWRPSPEVIEFSDRALPGSLGYAQLPSA